MRTRGPVAAAVPGWTLLASSVLALALLALLGRDPGRLVEAVRWGAVALALGVAGVFDDASAELHASLPTPDRRVRLRAVGLSLPAVLGGWAMLTWAADLPVVTGPKVATAFDECVALVRGGIAVEAAAVLATTLLAAAFAARRGAGTGAAIAGGTAAVMIYAAKAFVPEELSLTSMPAVPGWVPSQQRWALILVVATVALVLVAGDRWRRRNVGRGLIAVAAVAIAGVVFAATSQPDDVESTFAALVEQQELGGAEISIDGQAAQELRAGRPPGDLAGLQITLVIDGAVLGANVPVEGSLTARELRAWSASLPIIRDSALFAAEVGEQLPEGLRFRDPEIQPTGSAVGEVVVNQLTKTTVASVATPGTRTCGVAIAEPLSRVVTD